MIRTAAAFRIKDQFWQLQHVAAELLLNLLLYKRSERFAGAVSMPPRWLTSLFVNKLNISSSSNDFRLLLNDPAYQDKSNNANSCKQELYIKRVLYSLFKSINPVHKGFLELICRFRLSLHTSLAFISDLHLRKLYILRPPPRVLQHSPVHFIRLC